MVRATHDSRAFSYKHEVDWWGVVAPPCIYGVLIQHPIQMQVYGFNVKAKHVTMFTLFIGLFTQMTIANSQYS